MLFIDAEAGPHEAMTFREVFLGSHALENLIIGAPVWAARFSPRHHA